MIGQTLMVRHRSVQHKGGTSLEMSKDRDIRMITAVYMDGDVRDSCGESWKVERCNSADAQWMTTK